MKFTGNLPASKSMMIRALLLKSYDSHIQIVGQSKADDVLKMQECVEQIQKNSGGDELDLKEYSLDCGDAGAVLRFLSLRLARQMGTFRLTGSERLLKRPHEEIAFLCNQLDVSCVVGSKEITIEGAGWQQPEGTILVQRNQSSQFASSLLLNAWDLPFDLNFEMTGNQVSEGYFRMSVSVARHFGMTVNMAGKRVNIPAFQNLRPGKIEIDCDVSSAAVIAAAAALGGYAEIKNFRPDSLQPDTAFLDFYRSMGIPLQQQGTVVKVLQAAQIKPVEVDIGNSPDLFPSLAMLLAFSSGESVIKGAPHLIYKESNRLKKTLELLEKAKVPVHERPDGIKIFGVGSNAKLSKFEFDPDEDHRMAMAAALLKLKGYNIKIKNPQVVNKSFPEFWSIIGIQP